jgi:hypothetical protein
MISGATEGSIRAMDRGTEPIGPELIAGDVGNKRVSLSGNVAV